MHKLIEYYFWFSPPSTILTDLDRQIGLFFAAVLVLGAALRIFAWLSKNPINKQMLLKFWHLLFWIGILGLAWFGFRYENTQLFNRYFWVGLIALIGIIWLGFIVKYLIMNYRSQKIEYNKEQLKSKYLPKSR